MNEEPKHSQVVMMSKRRRSRTSGDRQRGAPDSQVVADPPVRPLAALRPITWSAVVSAAFAVAVAVPTAAHAEPVGIPDGGTRPVPSGALRLPGSAPITTGPVTTPVVGPLSAQITAKETQVAILGERRNALDEQIAQADTVRAQAESDWRAAADALADLRTKTDAAAQKEYRDATELAPLGPFGMDIHQFSRLVPRVESNDASPEALARELARAEEDERATFAVYNDALIVSQGLVVQRAQVNITFLQADTEYRTLLHDNENQLAAIEAQQEATERANAAKYGQPGISLDGTTSNPKAIAALKYAIAHLGAPYEWGAEGPNRFDCSGLMWAAYRSAGVTFLPRVANTQWRATTPVPVSQLLPGDLLFFATDKSDWTSIHHVGMYVGDGKMIHAPTTGDVVRISTVWWSRFYGATRVVAAVAAPVVTTPSPTPTQSSPPTSAPPTSAPPSSAPPSSEPPPSSEAPASAPPASSEAEPSESPSPTPTPSASAKGTEPSATPTPTGSGDTTSAP